MTCTISSFVTEIRDLTRDTITPYHHPDLLIHKAVKDAFVHMQSVRPESRYEGMRLVDTEFPEADSDLGAFEITFDRRWRLGILYYAAARCYEADITDSVNLQLAQTLLQKSDVEFMR